MDRTKAPKYKEIDHIYFIEPEHRALKNGIDLAIFRTGSQKVVKIDLVFEAGTMYQEKALQASTTNTMLQEGSKNFTADEIAEKLDFYGSHLVLNIDKDFAKVSLISLEKYLDEGLEILSDIAQNPSFPEEKLDRYLSKKLQSFKMDKQKVKELSVKKFTQELFGANHPYGKVAKEADFDNLSRKDLVDFYKKQYQPKTCKMLITGQFEDKTLDKIDQHFSSWESSNTPNTFTKFEAPKMIKKSFFIEKKDAMQSAVRLGRILFNQKHEDYGKMQVVNTLLGGYFGSRLMKNIREDKGYTYGIGSALLSLKETGYFTIVSEVNAKFSQATVKEIKKEIKILQSELVSEEELSKVKSYMLGRILRSVDGPFALSETFLNVWLYNMDWDYLKNQIKTIQNINSKEIKLLANRYLNDEDLIEIIAGK